MAHGFLAHYAPDAEIYSAGVETHGVNPRAIKSMQKAGIDISHHTSNNVDEYTTVPFDYVITVCDNAKERCPVFSTSAAKFHQNFKDPYNAQGDEAAVDNVFDTVRDEIDSYCKAFASAYL